MLVRCPKCKTTYKVSEEVLRGTTPVFRCSRCKHTFDLELTEPSERGAATTRIPEAPAPKTVQEQELSFTFAPKKDDAESKSQVEDRKELTDSPVPESRLSTAKHESPDQWSISVTDSKLEEPFTISETSDRIAEAKFPDAPKDPHPKDPPLQDAPPSRETLDNILPLDPFRDQPASAIPYLTLFGLLVIFFSLMTALYQAHPAASEGIVKKIPLLGASVLKNNHLKNGVALQALRAGYQSIQGNREVFVVTGVALNQNSVVIRAVQVSGQLYNQEGKEIEEQTIWLGNAISSKIVRGMTAQDISNLQGLQPLKTFGIPPGDSVPFTIVFFKPTNGIKDFSCAVLSAEDEA